jgi:hypothetical protein
MIVTSSMLMLAPNAALVLEFAQLGLLFKANKGKHTEREGFTLPFSY